MRTNHSFDIFILFFINLIEIFLNVFIWCRKLNVNTNIGGGDIKLNSK